MAGIVEGIARELDNVEGLTYHLTEASNVFEEDMPQEPDLAVSVVSAGGPEPSALHASDEQRVQLTFRAEPGSPHTATELWYRVFRHLHSLRRHELPDGTQLVWAVVMQPAPVRIGADENGRHRFTMNVRCEVREAEDDRGHRE